MRKCLLIWIALLCISGTYRTPSGAVQFGDILDKAKESLGGTALGEAEVIRGLKEALRIGTKRSVTAVSQEGGYYDNSRIRIPLPGAVRKVETLLRGAGYGPQVDAFELSMNRAAERAAPEAKAIFWDAIKQMTFSDAEKILEGRDNEATLYFQDKTKPRLQRIFKPIVHDTMAEVGVTRQYQELNDRVNAVPFAGSLTFDLDGYVTNQALDGLFYMLAQEEKKIRRNPAARTTDILKKVFGQ